MPRLINVDILKNPLNWLTVLLMLVIFGLFISVVANHHARIDQASAASNG
jgi:hypothetical protein